MLETLNPNFKSLGYSVFFPFILSYLHSVPLLLICTLVFSYHIRNYISHPKGNEYLLNNLKAASICLSTSLWWPEYRDRKHADPICRWHRKRYMSSLLTGRFRINLFNEYSLNSNYVLTLDCRNHHKSFEIPEHYTETKRMKLNRH